MTPDHFGISAGTAAAHVMERYPDCYISRIDVHADKGWLPVTVVTGSMRHGVRKFELLVNPETGEVKKDDGV
jgi:hypothetical protein